MSSSQIGFFEDDMLVFSPGGYQTVSFDYINFFRNCCLRTKTREYKNVEKR